jgi:hypothetical protein
MGLAYTAAIQRLSEKASDPIIVTRCRPGFPDKFRAAAFLSKLRARFDPKSGLVL